MPLKWFKWAKNLFLNKKANSVGESNKDSEKDSTKDIAVIGMSCRFPDAKNYNEFWDNLTKGVNSISEIPLNRWDVKKYYSSNRDEPNKSISKWAGLLDQIDTFDASFFGISPREAIAMDPQQRLMLEETWHCIEDAGIALKELQDAQTSVYVGVMATDYYQHMTSANIQTEGYDCLGNYKGIIANRLSYFYNFTGESQSIDAACASSLVALHYASNSLINGKSQYAIAAGVSLISHPWKYISFSKAHMLSPDGQCKVFDAAANGYVPGEGVGVLLLEPLEKAIENGHHIYGIIKGSEIGHSGKSKSITAPLVDAQCEVIENALANGNVSSETITYLEAHGTGTSLGDPIEVEALKRAFNTNEKQYCYIGSVKSNIGHLESAAGIAGIIKVLLMFKHRKIPKTLNIKNVNPIIDFENSPFRLADKLSEWTLPQNISVRRAGISSFGFGGVNSHVVFEEYTVKESHAVTEDMSSTERLPFILSAKNAESLLALLREWHKYTKTESFRTQALQDICLTLMLGRQVFPYRFSAMVQNKQDLITVLSEAVKLAAEKSNARSDECAGSSHDKSPTFLDKKAWVGEQKIILRLNPIENLEYSKFHNVCRHFPILSQLESECFEIIGKIGEKKLLQKLCNTNDVTFSQLSQFLILTILGKALLMNNLSPRYIQGNKVGELASAVLCGMLDFPTAISHLLSFVNVRDPVINQTQSIHLKRPAISFMGTRVIEPYQIPKAYCETLINSLMINPLIMQKLFEKSRLLLENQHTFKKFIVIWDNILAKYGISIADILNKPTELKVNQHNLLTIILFECQKKLNNKWDLAEKISIDDRNTSEIVDLLLDGVLSPKDVVSLLLEPSDAVFARVAKHIDTNQHKLDRKKPYYSLKQFNQSVKEIPDGQSWINNTLNDNQDLLNVNSKLDIAHALYVDIGGNDSLHAPSQWEETLPSYLLSLWQKCVFINWKLWYGNIKNKKIALPLYPFAVERYWISPAAEITEKTEKINIKEDTNLEIEKARPIEFPILQNSMTQHQVFPDKTREQDIAIIGMAGIFPGAPNLDVFWENLMQEKDAVTEIPKTRLHNWETYFTEVMNENRSKLKWGGFIEDVESFDARFFKISPREAELMDPQQCLFLEVVWHAIEDAGYTPKQLAAIKTGVFAGVSNNDYLELVTKLNETSAHVPTGQFHSVLANRVSYFFGLSGPSQPVDTACSSSLYAVNQAVESIRLGGCDVAIAGGVNIIFNPSMFVEFNKAGMLSKDGRCKTFDKSANGYVRGEGCGVIILKPLNKALNDKDRIYGVIKGSATNHGGHVNSLTVPNPNAQADVIMMAHKRAGIGVETISYIEAHGTGTPLGDPIEINGLKKAFQMLQSEQDKRNSLKNYCGIGSVKTNIGHLESASGIAGLIKILLAMQHGQLPGLIHFKELNPYIEVKDSPFYIAKNTTDWTRLKSDNNEEIPRRAGISSFGFGGANAHLIIEEAPKLPLTSKQQSKPWYLITLSAKTEASLKQKMIDLERWIAKLKTEVPESDILANISYTLNTRRMHFSNRCIIVASSLGQLQEDLSKLATEWQSPNSNIHISDDKKMQSKSDFKIEADQLIQELMMPNQISSNEYQIKLLSLGKLYLNGCAIDWNKLHLNESNKVISLPIYPFIKEHYSILSDKASHASISNSVKKSDTPLDAHAAPREGAGSSYLDMHATDLDKNRWTKKLSSKAFYLDDHRVQRLPVLPAAAYIEMAYQVGKMKAPKQSVVSLQNIIWMYPLHVTDEEKEIVLSLKQIDSHMAFVVKTEANESSKTSVHAQGKIMYKDGDFSKQNQLNIAAIKERCSNKHLATEIYSHFNAIGLNYGPSFQVIKNIYYNETETLSEIQLPSHLEQTANDFKLHPSILDSALQTTLSLLKNNKDLYLPFNIGQLDIISSLAKSSYVYVKADPESLKKQSPIFQIDILDANGNVLLHIKDFIVRRVQTDISPRPKPVHYQPLWIKGEKLENAINVEGPILIFDETGDLTKLIKDKLTLKPIVQVKSGYTYKKINQSEYCINKNFIQDYISLFKQLEEEDLLPRQIIYRTDLSYSSDILEKEIPKELKQTYEPLFYLFKAIIAQKIKLKINILCLNITKNERSTLFFQALPGFAKTLHMEQPNLTCRIVEVYRLEDVLHELRDGDIEVKYDKNGERWTKTYEVITSPTYVKPVLKKQGVYLITGGMGGLGLIFSRYLASQYQAKLLLLGRSELDEKQNEIMTELKTLGASEVQYLRVDITKYDDLSRIMRDVKRQFQTINGVIHSAGVIRDAFIYKKTPEQVEQVLAPKIYGTVNLDEVTKSESLDFFVMFSSIMADTGNVGQCDYVYANGFMGAFADHRDHLQKRGQRQGKSLAVHWPLWAEGGMQINESSIKYIKVVFGLVPLPTTDGIRAFTNALSQEYIEQVVFIGDTNKIAAKFGSVKTSKTNTMDFSKEVK